jgi:hypothetical protein
LIALPEDSSHLIHLKEFKTTSTLHIMKSTLGFKDFQKSIFLSLYLQPKKAFILYSKSLIGAFKK